MLKVSDVLKTKGSNVWSVSPETTVYRALEIMADKKIGALVVLEGEKLAGIFSERDYARKVILRGRTSRETPVGELMTSEVFTVSPDKSLEECMALMSAIHARHLPIVESDRVIGVMSLGDAVKAVMEEQKVTIQDLQNFITGS